MRGIKTFAENALDSVRQALGRARLRARAWAAAGLGQLPGIRPQACRWSDGEEDWARQGQVNASKSRKTLEGRYLRNAYSLAARSKHHGRS